MDYQVQHSNTALAQTMLYAPYCLRTSIYLRRINLIELITQKDYVYSAVRN
jgi:hypothetical protein